MNICQDELHDWQDATSDIPEEQIASGKYCIICRIPRELNV